MFRFRIFLVFAFENYVHRVLGMNFCANGDVRSTFILFHSLLINFSITMKALGSGFISF